MINQDRVKKASVYVRIGESITLKDFGAVGDGIANDTAAINAAFASGKPLIFTEGTYRITTPIVYTSATIPISIRGQGKVIIDATSITSGVVFTIGGTLGSEVSNLLSAVNMGAVGFSTSASMSLSADDYALIDSPDSFCKQHSYYTKGEIVSIKSVANTKDYILKSRLWDSYNPTSAAGTTVVRKLNLNRVSIEGIDIKCNAVVTALQIEYGRQITLKNCRINGSRTAGVNLFRCLGGTVSDNVMYDNWDDVGLTGISLNVGACQGLTIEKNELLSGSWGLVLGGTATIPTRGVTVKNNTLDCQHESEDQPAFMVNGNCEYILVEDNTSLNGMLIQGRNITVDTNRVFSANNGVTGISVLVSHDVNDYMIFKGNQVDTQSVSATTGIRISMFQDSSTLSYLRFDDNIVRSSGAACVLDVESGTTAEFNITRMDMNDNDFVSVASSPLKITPTASNKVNIIYGDVKGGRMRSNTDTGPMVSLSATNSLNLRFTNTTFEVATTSKNAIDSLTGVKDVDFINCIFNGTGLGGTKVNIGNTRNLRIIGSQFKNLRGTPNNVVITSATDFQFKDNIVVNCTGTELYSLPAGVREVIDYFGNGNARVRGVNAPTTGTFKAGDIVINNTPTVIRNIVQWICVSSGTPGTWVAVGCGAGTTANRPTLLASDNGYLYADSTSGLIRWNGSAWDVIGGTSSGGTTTSVDINVKSYGAVGDGTTNDFTSITNAITAANALSASVSGIASTIKPYLFFPHAVGYQSNSPVVIPAGMRVLMEAPLVYNGGSGVGLTIGASGVINQNVELKLNVYNKTQSDWSTETSIGIKLINLIDSSLVQIVRASGFTIGVQCIGDSGDFTYNKIDLGAIRNNKIGVDLNNKRGIPSGGSVAVNGVCNDNLFTGGRIGQDAGVNGTTSRYGVRISSDGNYTTNNNNVFVKPSFDLIEGTENVGVLIEYGVQNSFISCGWKSTGDLLARVINSSEANKIEAGYSTVTTVVDDQSNSRSNNLVKQAQALLNSNNSVFNSGQLIKKSIYSNGLSTRVNVAGLAIMTFNSTTIAFDNTQVSLGVDYIELNARGIGIFMDTNAVKRFVVKRNVVSGFGGRVVIRCFDSSGAQISSAGATVLVRGYAIDSFAATTNYGGGYVTGSDATNDVFFWVDSTVKSVQVLLTDGTAVARIRSFSISTPDIQAVSTWSGYEEIEVGANLVSAAPTTGTWAVGRKVYMSPPVAGLNEGWICTASGTPGTWKTFGFTSA